METGRGQRMTIAQDCSLYSVSGQKQTNHIKIYGIFMSYKVTQIKYLLSFLT